MDVEADTVHHRVVSTRALTGSDSETHHGPTPRWGPESALRAPELSPAIRVLLLDDSAAFRSAARALLRRRGYCLAAEADCAASAVGLAARISLDAVLLDIRLPDLNGFALAAQLIATYPPLAVLMMSASFDAEFYRLAEACGARGFVPKHQLAQVDLAQFFSCPRSALGPRPEVTSA